MTRRPGTKTGKNREYNRSERGKMPAEMAEPKKEEYVF